MSPGHISWKWGNGRWYKVKILHLLKYIISNSHSSPKRQAFLTLFLEEETQVQRRLRNLLKVKASIWKSQHSSQVCLAARTTLSSVYLSHMHYFPLFPSLSSWHYFQSKTTFPISFPKSHFPYSRNTQTLVSPFQNWPEAIL